MHFQERRMNKTAKETIIGTVLSYIGIAIGAYYTIFIIPKVFDKTPEQYGTLVALVNYVAIFVTFSSFASNYSLLKFLPISSQSDKEQIMSFLLRINLLGTLLGIFAFYLYSQYSPLLIGVEGKAIDFSFFFYPLLISNTLFSYFQSYCITLMNVAYPIFLNNTFTKFWTFIILLLLLYKFIDFEVFSYLYFSQFVIIFILLMVFVWRRKELKISLLLSKPSNYKAILNYSVFTLLTSAAIVLVTRIDIQLVEHYIGRAEVGFYSIALFFITVLLTPKNMLSQVARGIVSRDFQKQDITTFTPKYQKINMAFLIGTLLVFIAIAINVNELMSLLGKRFGSAEIKYVILILGAGRTLESVFVVNSNIIEYSKYYRWSILFELLSLFLLLLLSWLFIPMYGILGIAGALAITYVFGALVKTIFVYVKYRLKPIKRGDFCKILIIGSLFLIALLPIKIFVNIAFDIEDVILQNSIIIGLRTLLFCIFALIILEKTGMRKLFLNLRVRL